MSKAKYRLMAPGPVMLDPEIRKILGQDMIHHRSPLFKQDLANVFQLLPKIFRTNAEVLCFGASGSGAMQASVSNFISKDQKALVIVSGKFGERWEKMLKKRSNQVISYKVEWGKNIDLKDLEKILSQNPDLDALYTQVCETSSGHLHQIKEISKLLTTNCKNALFIVDAITAILTLPFNMKEDGVDICIAGSQKAFMLPTGLSFLALSQRAKSRLIEHDDFYFDIKLELQAQIKQQTAFSTSVNLVRALSYLLKKIEQTGMENFIYEVQRRSYATKKALTSLGLNFVSQNPAPALSAFYTPKGIDAKKLRQHIEEKYNMTFMGGQEHLEGKILRIGHMGYIQKQDVLDSIDFLCQGLQDFGHKVEIKKALDVCEKAYDEY